MPGNPSAAAASAETSLPVRANAAAREERVGLAGTTVDARAALTACGTARAEGVMTTVGGSVAGQRRYGHGWRQQRGAVGIRGVEQPVGVVVDPVVAHLGGSAGLGGYGDHLEEHRCRPARAGGRDHERRVALGEEGLEVVQFVVEHPYRCAVARRLEGVGRVVGEVADPADGHAGDRCVLVEVPGATREPGAVHVDRRELLGQGTAGPTDVAWCLLIGEADPQCQPGREPGRGLVERDGEGERDGLACRLRGPVGQSDRRGGQRRVRIDDARAKPLRGETPLMGKLNVPPPVPTVVATWGVTSARAELKEKASSSSLSSTTVFPSKVTVRSAGVGLALRKYP